MDRAVTVGVAFVSLVVTAVATVRGESPAPDAPAGQSLMCLVGRWNDYTGLYSDVWADGDYAYLPNWGADGNPGRVHILDISNPASPELASTFFLSSPNQGASPQDVKVADGLLFIALESDGNDGVAIVDVRDPTAPALLATVRVPGYEFVHNLFYDNGFLYFPGGTTIAIVDLTSFDPDNPPLSPITTAKWILSDVGSSNVHDITVRNGRLYAAAWNSGLWIYDVSNVAATLPTLLGSVGGSATHSMWPTDDGQFVVTGEERFGGGIQVYRITGGRSSLTLTLTDSLVLPDTFSVHNQIIVGNRLYNSWYAQGLQAFDIDPVTGQLEPAGSFDTSLSGTGNWGVYPLLGPDLILLSDTNEGLYVVSSVCECVGSSPPDADVIESEVSTKNRFISFTSGDVGQTQAVRVTFVDLPAPFDQWNNQSLWVGSPQDVSENGSSVVPIIGFSDFKAATLQCGGPMYLDWNALGTVHVFHEGIVPGGTYRIQLIDSGCIDLGNESSYSAPLEVTTALWGDTLGECNAIPCSPPDAVVNIIDVTGILGRFISDPNSITKSRADLEPDCLDLVINIADVLFALSGFQGLSYPFEPSALDPCDSTCRNPLP